MGGEGLLPAGTKYGIPALLPAIPASTKKQGLCSGMPRVVLYALVACMVALALLCVPAVGSWMAINRLRDDLAAAGFSHDTLTNHTRWQSLDLAFSGLPTAILRPLSGSGGARLVVQGPSGGASIALDATTNNASSLPVVLSVASGTARVLDIDAGAVTYGSLRLTSTVVSTPVANVSDYVQVGAASLGVDGHNFQVVADGTPRLRVDLSTGMLSASGLAGLTGLSVDGGVTASGVHGLTGLSVNGSVTASGIQGLTGLSVDGGVTATRAILTGLHVQNLTAGSPVFGRISTSSLTTPSVAASAIGATTLQVATLTATTTNAGTVSASSVTAAAATVSDLTVQTQTQSIGGSACVREVVLGNAVNTLYYASACGNDTLMAPVHARRLDTDTGSAWYAGILSAAGMRTSTINASSALVAPLVSAHAISASYVVAAPNGVFDNLTVSHLNILNGTHAVDALNVSSITTDTLLVRASAEVASLQATDVTVRGGLSVVSGVLSAVSVETAILTVSNSGVRIEDDSGVAAIMAGAGTRVATIGTTGITAASLSTGTLAAGSVSASTIATGSLSLSGLSVSNLAVSLAQTDMQLWYGGQPIYRMDYGTIQYTGPDEKGIMQTCTDSTFANCESLMTLINQNGASSAALWASRVVMTEPGTSGDAAINMVIYNKGIALPSGNALEMLHCADLPAFARHGDQSSCSTPSSVAPIVRAAQQQPSQQRGPRIVHCTFSRQEVFGYAEYAVDELEHGICDGKVNDGCAGALEAWDLETGWLQRADVRVEQGHVRVYFWLGGVAARGPPVRVSLRTAHTC